MLKSLAKIIWPIFAVCFFTSCTLKPVHTPYYVDNISQRAQYIAAQTCYLTPKVVALALIAYNKVQAQGYGEKHILTIIDYSDPSNHNRFWVIDLSTNKVLFRELVAHGIGSGELYATHFSDKIDSRTTSIGMYITAQNDYHGRHGHSLRLKGLEAGFNGNAWSRAIVIHSAPYVCNQFIQKHGFVGRSWGCIALNPKDINQIIATLKGGTLIFAYANDPNWLNHSNLLH
jgi:hypothetical protein